MCPWNSVPCSVCDLLIPHSPEVHFRGIVGYKTDSQHPQCLEPLWPEACAQGTSLLYLHLSKLAPEGPVLQTLAPARKATVFTS